MFLFFKCNTLFIFQLLEKDEKYRKYKKFKHFF